MQGQMCGLGIIPACTGWSVGQIPLGKGFLQLCRADVVIPTPGHAGETLQGCARSTLPTAGTWKQSHFTPTHTSISPKGDLLPWESLLTCKQSTKRESLHSTPKIRLKKSLWGNSSCNDRLRSPSIHRSWRGQNWSLRSAGWNQQGLVF